MTKPTTLTHSARVVHDAFWATINDKCNIYDKRCTQLASALRAVAYQVAPARPSLDSCCQHFEQSVRHKILSIATELEENTSTED